MQPKKANHPTLNQYLAIAKWLEQNPTIVQNQFASEFLPNMCAAIGMDVSIYSLRYTMRAAGIKGKRECVRESNRTKASLFDDQARIDRLERAVKRLAIFVGVSGIFEEGATGHAKH